MGVQYCTRSVYAGRPRTTNHPHVISLSRTVYSF
jgi:hypothetical protein